MDREICEKKILEKLHEIWRIYKKYNPGGTHVSLCVIDDEPHTYYTVTGYDDVPCDKFEFIPKENEVEETE